MYMYTIIIFKLVKMITNFMEKKSLYKHELQLSDHDV